MVKRLAGAALFFAVVAGCDPGLRYVLPGAVRVKDNGTRYVVGVSQGVDVRFHSNVSIQEGWVEIEVLNRGTAPVYFERTPPVIADGSGTPVEPSWCMFQNLTSQTTARDIERRDVIARGQRALITCRFPVRLGRWSTYPPESRRVSFTQPGFTQSDRPLDIHATMVAE
jgi:hypothetical protein